MSHQVFISYSKNDRAIADTVVANLEKESINCWIAPRDIPYGSSYAASIVSGIRSTEIFLLIFTKSSNASEHVLNEIEMAISIGKQVIPFKVEDLQYSDSLEYYLRTKQAAIAFDKSIDRGIHELKIHLKRILERTKSVENTTVVASTFKTIQEEVHKPENEVILENKENETVGSTDSLVLKYKMNNKKWIVSMSVVIIGSILMSDYFDYGAICSFIFIMIVSIYLTIFKPIKFLSVLYTSLAGLLFILLFYVVDKHWLERSYLDDKSQFFIFFILTLLINLLISYFRNSLLIKKIADKAR